MLLSYDEALARILAQVGPLERTPGADGQGSLTAIRVLSTPLVAVESNPRFDNSSVDGYAIHGDDLNRVGERLGVSFTVAAGDASGSSVAQGKAVRILTGAALPVGTAAVAMQEDVVAEGAFVTLNEPLSAGAGLRKAGDDFSAGETLLEVGTPVTPGVGGLLASQGVVQPKFFALPRCLILTTGDEIIPPDKTPGPTQVRDSIGWILGLASSRYAVFRTDYAPDEPAKLKRKLKSASKKFDAIFVAGGASVGDRDFMASVVAEIGTVEFHGISVRPGKPLLFGFINGKPVLGLPGNPASAYVCFHLFGVPLLRRLGGWASPRHLWFKAPFGAEHEPEARDVFARVSIVDGTVTPVREQASFGLRSLGEAQAMARLLGGTRVLPGDSVEITLL